MQELAPPGDVQAPFWPGGYASRVARSSPIASPACASPAFGDHTSSRFFEPLVLKQLVSSLQVASLLLSWRPSGFLLFGVYNGISTPLFFSFLKRAISGTPLSNARLDCGDDASAAAKSPQPAALRVMPGARFGPGPGRKNAQLGSRINAVSIAKGVD